MQTQLRILDLGVINVNPKKIVVSIFFSLVISSVFSYLTAALTSCSIFRRPVTVFHARDVGGRELAVKSYQKALLEPSHFALLVSETYANVLL